MFLRRKLSSRLLLEPAEQQELERNAISYYASYCSCITTIFCYGRLYFNRTPTRIFTEEKSGHQQHWSGKKNARNLCDLVLRASNLLCSKVIFLLLFHLAATSPYFSVIPSNYKITPKYAMLTENYKLSNFFVPCHKIG